MPSPAIPPPCRPHRCAVRPAALLITPPPPTDTLKARLERLLHLLPTYAERASQSAQDAASSVPALARRLFAKDGPLGALQFWRENKEAIEDTGRSLLDTGESVVRGDSDAFKRAARRLDFRWLRRQRPVEPQGEAVSPAVEFCPERAVANVLLFAVESLAPWDFDRHDFGLTFANTWVDADALPAVDGGRPPVVKMTSIIKPLEREWKLTARSKLVDVGEGGAVFGKAGVFLAGERPAYVGVEADRVWKVPGLPRSTKVFVNVNYRSSRKPETDPIRTSFGVQQDFEVFDGIALTLRIGTNPLERDKFFVTPVPNGSYF